LLSLVYWLREGRETNAEVDYVISRGPEIFPVEVKAGRKGSLRSLQQFVAHTGKQVAIRFDLNQPSQQCVNCRIPGHHNCDMVHFDLLSLPLYAVGELARLLDRLRAEKD